MVGVAVNTVQISSFEELTSAVKGARSEVIQLDPGSADGVLSHLLVDDLPVNVGSFSVGVRSRGILSPDRITLGMLTATEGHVTHWSREMYPGDVLVTPPGVEYGGRYFGGASFVTTSLDHSDIRSHFAQEPRIADPETWHKNHVRGVPDPIFIPRLQDILQQVIDMHAVLSDDAARFWRKTIIEMMTFPVIRNVPADSPAHLPSAIKIVREAERHIDLNSSKPIHISEVCNQLNVSRRTLHRAFHETLGIGPITFLRRKRLCSVHSTLLRSTSDRTTIAEVAMQYGFFQSRPLFRRLQRHV